MISQQNQNTNPNEEVIIDFIEEKEVHEFANNIQKKKKIITAFIIGGTFALLAISAYILPDFLSTNHKKQMQYSANSVIFSNPDITTTKILKDEILHGANH